MYNQSPRPSQFEVGVYRHFEGGRPHHLRELESYLPHSHDQHATCLSPCQPALAPCWAPRLSMVEGVTVSLSTQVLDTQNRALCVPYNCLNSPNTQDTQSLVKSNRVWPGQQKLGAQGDRARWWAHLVVNVYMVSASAKIKVEERSQTEPQAKEIYSSLKHA